MSEVRDGRTRPGNRTDREARGAIASRRSGGRRLLIASIGAATLSWGGCGNDVRTLVANLMAPPFMPPNDAGRGRDPVTPGHLDSSVAPQPPESDSDAGTGDADAGR